VVGGAATDRAPAWSEGAFAVNLWFMLPPFQNIRNAAVAGGALLALQLALLGPALPTV
jgi:hypothetical protein